MLFVLLHTISNVICSVGLIFLCKYVIFRQCEFRANTFLTLLHLLATYYSCFLYSRYKRQPVNIDVSAWRVLPLSTAFCGYVLFSNLSLLFNDVCVYQASKIFCTPVIVFLSMKLMGQTQTRTTLCSLFVTCLGVLIFYYASADINILGLFFAAMAVLSASYNSVWSSTKQTELALSALELLMVQSKLSCYLMAALTLPLDGFSAFANQKISFTLFWSVLLSCFLAFYLNLTGFILVERTSPVTMNALAYMKSVIVMSLDMVLGYTIVTRKGAVGMCVTLVGFTWYVYLKCMALSKKPSALPNKNND